MMRGSIAAHPSGLPAPRRCASLAAMQMKRRKFLGLAAGAAAAGANGLRGTVAAAEPAAAAQPAAKLLLGYDNFAVRALGWKAPQLIEHAAKLQVDSLFISDLDAFESLADAALAEIRRRAEDAGLRLFLGTWSICPSSVTFKDKWGDADAHLALGLRAAKALGSPVLRVILGSNQDRTTPGGIEARIADTVAVLKRNRTRALDAGVKVAVENHAGDMHSRELLGLIEAAGPDFAGANLDAGNALWALEDPLDNLETLGRHVLCTSLRDSALWPSGQGVTVQWTAMGEGMVDWTAYFKRFAELCPQAPVHIETISGFNRELPVKQDGFWQAWPQGKPPGYDRFLALAAKGRPRAPWAPPAGTERQAAERDYQLGELARSIAFCKGLGLGRR